MFLDTGLNLGYVLNGDCGSLIPDEEDQSGLEFRELRELLFDSVGNMIVVDKRSEHLKVLDKDRRYIGDVKVGFDGHAVLVFDDIVPQVDHPPYLATSVCLDNKKGELYVSYYKANTIHKYQL